MLMEATRGKITKCRLLLEPNRRGELPIVVAFNLQRWEIVEVLLEACIECKVLPELTGVNAGSSELGKSLLFKAMKRGHIPYLEIFLRVYQKCTNSIPMRAMQLSDKKKHTPWYYFLSLDVEKIEMGLGHLNKHGVDINELLCDKAGRTCLLHEAFRRDNHTVCDLLVKYGAKQDQLDAKNRFPQQRRRILSIDSRPPTPILHLNGFSAESPVG